MLIGRIEQDPKKNLSLSVRQSVIERLDNYRALYELTYGVSIDRSELIDRLLDTALDKDKDFRKYERDLKRQGTGAGTGDQAGVKEGSVSPDQAGDPANSPDGTENDAAGESQMDAGQSWSPSDGV